MANPWVKVWRKQLLHFEFRELSESSQLHFFYLLLASEDDGLVPDVQKAAWAYHLNADSLRAAIADLTEIRFIQDGRWTKWSEYQGKTSTERVRKHRGKRFRNEDETFQKQDGNALEKRREEKKEPIGSLSDVPSDTTTRIDYQGIIEAWNLLCPKKKIRSIEAERRTHLKARVKAYPERAKPEHWTTMLEGVKERVRTDKGEWMNGGNGCRWFKFDWLVESETNFCKVEEGNYADTSATADPADDWRDRLI